MPDEQGVVRRVAWSEIFPWLQLVPCVKLAMRFRMLLPATAAVLLTIFGWWLLAAQLFKNSDDGFIVSVRAAYASCPWEVAPFAATNPDLSIDERLDDPPVMGEFSRTPLRSGWKNLSGPMRQLFNRTITFQSLAFLLLCTLWAVAVWSLFGGAITRMAAMQLGREESIGWGSAARYARSRWGSYFNAPLLPLGGVMLITAPIALIGLFLRWQGFGTLLVGLAWPLLMLGGLLMAIILLGLLFGWPLMYPAISAEGGDSFDALSRAYSYVYQRPWHYLFYALVASLLGMLGATLVYGFSEGVIYLTRWAVSWGSGNENNALSAIIAAHTSDAPPLFRAGGWLIWFFNGCVRAIAIGFIYSYFWSASTAMYLLLRHHVDGAEMDEIDVPESDEAYNLPPLKTDAAGVPMPADENDGNNGNGEEPPPDDTPSRLV